MVESNTSKRKRKLIEKQRKEKCVIRDKTKKMTNLGFVTNNGNKQLAST